MYVCMYVFMYIRSRVPESMSLGDHTIRGGHRDPESGLIYGAMGASQMVPQNGWFLMETPI